MEREAGPEATGLPVPTGWKTGRGEGHPTRLCALPTHRQLCRAELAQPYIFSPQEATFAISHYPSKDTLTLVLTQGAVCMASLVQEQGPLSTC